MFAQGSLKSRIALPALLPSFSNRSRTDSWSFGIVEDPLRHHEMLQSVTLRRLPAATLHGCIHGGSRTWRSSGAPSKDSAATLPAVILANRLRMTRCCAQNERVVFTNKLSITSVHLVVVWSDAPKCGALGVSQGPLRMCRIRSRRPLHSLRSLHSAPSSHACRARCLCSLRVRVDAEHTPSEWGAVCPSSFPTA